MYVCIRVCVGIEKKLKILDNGFRLHGVITFGFPL